MIPGLDLVLQFSRALGERIPKETFPRAGATVEKGQHYPGGYRGAGSAVFIDSSVHSLFLPALAQQQRVEPDRELLAWAQCPLG